MFSSNRIKEQTKNWRCAAERPLLLEEAASSAVASCNESAFIFATIHSNFLLQTDDTGVAELQQGGVIYLLGVVFFKLDGRLPLAHAIWHLHVVVASMIHYHAVDKYLISPEE